LLQPQSTVTCHILNLIQLKTNWFRYILNPTSELSCIAFKQSWTYVHLVYVFWKLFFCIKFWITIRADKFFHTLLCSLEDKRNTHFLIFYPFGMSSSELNLDSTASALTDSSLVSPSFWYVNFSNVSMIVLAALYCGILGSNNSP